MYNRIPFLQRVMDEVHRQPAPQAGGAAERIEPGEGQFAESGVTPLQPLQMFVEVEVLRTLVADALEALRWSESRICTTAARRAAWDQAVDQRRQFLSWLTTVGHRKVFLAIYPEYLLDGSEEEGLGEESAA
jgi:hypothetical protein